MINTASPGWYSCGGNTVTYAAGSGWDTLGIKNANVKEPSKFAVLGCPKAPNSNVAEHMLSRANRMHCKIKPIADNVWGLNTDAHDGYSFLAFADGHAAKYDYKEIKWVMFYLDQNKGYASNKKYTALNHD